jgi:hypothetical protein
MRQIRCWISGIQGNLQGVLLISPINSRGRPVYFHKSRRLLTAEPDFSAQFNRELLPLHQGIATSVSGNCIGSGTNGMVLGGRKRKKMSAAARAKISAAQKKRWAKTKSPKGG